MDLKPFPQKKEFRGSFFASIFFYSVLLLSLLILFPEAGLSAQVTLAWDPNTESNLARYEVGYGTISRDNNSGQYVTVENVGLNTSYRITGLTDGVTYYFGVRAVNTEGLRSGYSNEVMWSSSGSPTATLSVGKLGTGTGTVSGNGIGCGTDCSEPFALGTVVTLTATPDAGSVFGGWSGGCGSSPTCTVTVNSNMTVMAAFNNTNPTNTQTLTILKIGTGTGTVANSPAGNSFSPGTKVTLKATADVSSVFSGWSGSCGTNPTCTVSMNSDLTVTAAFNLKSFTITAAAGANGSISPAGTTTVNYGSSRAYTITPASGYRVSAVTVDGRSEGAVRSYAFSNVTSNQTISATFVPAAAYNLTVLKNGTGTGSITNSPKGNSFPPGTVVTLLARPDASSIFNGWSGGCTGTNPACTMTMNDDISVVANFRKIGNSYHKKYIPLIIND